MWWAKSDSGARCGGEGALGRSSFGQEYARLAIRIARGGGAVAGFEKIQTAGWRCSLRSEDGGAVASPKTLASISVHQRLQTNPPRHSAPEVRPASRLARPKLVKEPLMNADER